MLRQTRAGRQRNLSQLPERKEQDLKYSQRNRCLSWFRFMNSQGRLLSSEFKSRERFQLVTPVIWRQRKPLIEGSRIVRQKSCRYVFESISLISNLCAYTSQPVTFLKIKSMHQRWEEPDEDGLPQCCPILLTSFQSPVCFTAYPL